MRSFAISAFATLAFGLLSSAAPVLTDGGLINVDHGSGLNIASVNMGSSGTPPAQGSQGTQVTPVKQTRSEDKCLDGILDGVVDVVESVIEEISVLTGDECTADILIPIIGKVEKVLEAAIVDVKSLTGLSITRILTGVEGLVLSLEGLAELICKVLKVVIRLVECILHLVTAAVKVDILPVLNRIIELVCELLSCVLALVGNVLGGILGVVVALLKEVIPTIYQLNLTAVIKLLCL